MRKLWLLVISLGIILGVLGGLGVLGINSWLKYPEPVAIKPTASQVGKAVKVKVNLQVIFGETSKTNPGLPQINTEITAGTAFEALKTVAEENKLELKTKQYDFGVLVESIAGFANTKDKSWIYFVNGKSGDVAADKYDLKEGDKVEWKYIKPTF